MPLFCLKRFLREPKPTKKGIRALLGILGSRVSAGVFEATVVGLGRAVEGVMESESLIGFYRLLLGFWGVLGFGGCLVPLWSGSRRLACCWFFCPPAVLRERVLAEVDGLGGLLALLRPHHGFRV